MKTKILDGKFLSKKIKKKIFLEIEKIKNKGNFPPHIAIILVGNNKDSKIYVKNKINDCKKVGIKYSLFKKSNLILESKLINLILKLNYDPYIDGLIIQLPLPKQINEKKIIIYIHPNKDIDGLHPINLGKIILNINTILPATPLGILTLLKFYNINTLGKKTVILGRSIIVGKPISILMGRKGIPGNSTVTLINSYTKNIINFTLNADIIIIALGIPFFLKKNMINKGAIIIDVGINKIKNTYNKYKIVGDADFYNLYGKASYLTPVPGGIGPLTRVMLLKNVLFIKKNNIFK